MANYYIDKRGNYYSNFNNLLYINAARDKGDIYHKRYKTMMYINGEFKKVKPHIGMWKEEGFITSDNAYFTTVNDQRFSVAGNSPLAFMADADDIEQIFSFTQVCPYFIFIEKNDIPVGALTDNNGNILIDNIGNILIDSAVPSAVKQTLVNKQGQVLTDIYGRKIVF